MKKIIYSLLAFFITAAFMFALPITAQEVLPVLIDVKVEEGTGIRYMIKSYEATPDYEVNFELLTEEPFDHEGLRYTFQYVSANEVTRTDSKWERAEASFPVDSEDLAPVFQQLEPSIPYGGGDGYAGMLELDRNAVWVQIVGYTNKSYTLTDTVELAGLSSNDTSNIPKTREKSGVTMTLVNVDWTVQESASIGYDSVPVKYTAAAHYSGAYSKKVPSGFLARAWYGGNVEKSSVEKIVYSVTYAAELPPETTPTSESESAESSVESVSETNTSTEGQIQDTTTSPSTLTASEPDQNSDNSIVEPLDESTSEKSGDASASTPAELETAESDENSEDEKDSGRLFPVIIGVILLAGLSAFWYFNWFNVFISVGDGVEGYKRIAKRHINPENPVIDLQRLNLSGRLSIDVMERAADKLKRKEIKTLISDDYTAVNIVKKRNKNFRYVVNIPERVSEDSET